jgi:cytochrome c|tara:strand:- start:1364 stop:1741 length:378 start_codon:yes stop_codon:yes gene_type:complete
VNQCLRHLTISLVLSCFANLTVQANPLTGKQLYDIACSACHSLGQTPDHHIGPPLGGLLNRQAGAVEGYRYSEALRDSGWRWSLPTLLAWLAEPDAALPNNAMNYVNPLTAEETQRLGEWLLRKP